MRRLISLLAVLGTCPALAAALPGEAAAHHSVRGAQHAGPSGDGILLGTDTTVPDTPTYWNSPTWSGWIDIANKNVELRYVTANFTVPTVHCGASGEEALFFVGLDGWSATGIPVPVNKTVEQAGVFVKCDISTPSGIMPSYHAWYEMYPDPSHTGGAVSAGDTIAVSVYHNSATGDYSLALGDSNSTSPDFNVTKTCPSGYTCHNATAEVIVEDPDHGAPNGVYLANFGTIGFIDVAVTSRNGTHGNLLGNSLWTANKITMVYPGSTVMALPGGRNANYTGFNETWKSSG